MDYSKTQKVICERFINKKDKHEPGGHLRLCAFSGFLQIWANVCESNGVCCWVQAGGTPQCRSITQPSLWRGSESSSVSQCPVRAPFLLFPSLFRFPRACWQAQAEGMQVCSASVLASWASTRTGPDCTAMADCCFCSSGREEEPLPGAPVRHGRPFLCEALMATRWRLNTQEGGGAFSF